MRAEWSAMQAAMLRACATVMPLPEALDSASDSSNDAGTASSPSTTVAPRSLLSCTVCTFRSTLCSVTKRSTVTGSSCPMRWMRLTACRSVIGLYTGSTTMAIVPLVRLRPTPPHAVVHRKTRRTPLWKSRTRSWRSSKGTSPSMRMKGSPLSSRAAPSRSSTPDHDEKTTTERSPACSMAERTDLILGVALDTNGWHNLQNTHLTVSSASLMPSSRRSASALATMKSLTTSAQCEQVRCPHA
mmetsp:Transcript_1911/g.6072  ORF Transcript_1911/g.6072 Transcript_1911/m.6072 type:complete len:243 (+) Transcript_1911:3089-3817(+)